MFQEPLRIQEIEASLIDQNPGRLRKIDDDFSLLELAESIKSMGILSPIIVRKDGDRFTIMAGERRYSAALLAHRSKIPCIIKEADDFEFLSLIENIQRKDLEAIDECIAIERLLNKGLRCVEVAAIIGKSHTYVSRATKIARFAARYGETDKLSGAIMADGRKLGMEHLLHLASQPTHKASCDLLEEILNKSIAVPALRAMTKPLLPQHTDLQRRLSSIRERLDLPFLRSAMCKEFDEHCLKELEHLHIALTEAQHIVEKILTKCSKP